VFVAGKQSERCDFRFGDDSRSQCARTRQRDNAFSNPRSRVRRPLTSQAHARPATFGRKRKKGPSMLGIALGCSCDIANRASCPEPFVPNHLRAGFATYRQRANALHASMLWCARRELAAIIWSARAPSVFRRSSPRSSGLLGALRRRVPPRTPRVVVGFDTTPRGSHARKYKPTRSARVHSSARRAGGPTRPHANRSIDRTGREMLPVAWSWNRARGSARHLTRAPPREQKITIMNSTVMAAGTKEEGCCCCWGNGSLEWHRLKPGFRVQVERSRFHHHPNMKCEGWRSVPSTNSLLDSGVLFSRPCDSEAKSKQYVSAVQQSTLDR
jgi:hypothetical protein